jgi:hypothetical protein
MMCSCCQAEEVDAVLDTPLGTELFCEACADSWFYTIISQGRTEYECTSGN